jgi:hypothetical protein
MDEIKRKKSEAFSVFEDKVDISDYHCFVPMDMHFSLIRQRLVSNWYRHAAEL